MTTPFAADERHRVAARTGHGPVPAGSAYAWAADVGQAVAGTAGVDGCVSNTNTYFP